MTEHTERVHPTNDDYAEAVALSRATLHGDDDAILVLLTNTDSPGNLIQSAIRLYVTTLLRLTGSIAEVDKYFEESLQNLQQESESEQ